MVQLVHTSYQAPRSNSTGHTKRPDASFPELSSKAFNFIVQACERSGDVAQDDLIFTQGSSYARRGRLEHVQTRHCLLFNYE